MNPDALTSAVLADLARAPAPALVPVAPPTKRALKQALRRKLAAERGETGRLSGRQWRMWRKDDARKRRAAG